MLNLYDVSMLVNSMIQKESSVFAWQYIIYIAIFRFSFAFQQCGANYFYRKCLKKMK